MMQYWFEHADPPQLEHVGSKPPSSHWPLYFETEHVFVHWMMPPSGNRGGGEGGGGHGGGEGGGGDGGGGDGGGEGGGGDGGGGGGGGGAAPHHVRIIEMSGAVVLGRPPPSRTPSSCAGLRATSHTSRSFIWPVNVPSPAQLLLPTRRLERLTRSGKRIDDVVATLTPFQ